MIISIDGATRRPGKPDCLAVGGVFIKGETNAIVASHELNSTNQRGEMWALITALRTGYNLAVANEDNDMYIITDSEYLYNAVTKDWIGNWANKGWITAQDTPVKNQDLWLEIKVLLNQLADADIEVMIYHIKGHLVSLGKVTAAKLLYENPTGEALYEAVSNKYDITRRDKPETFYKAEDLFNTNHGFKLDEERFKQFVVLNVVADYIAGTYADKINAESAV